VTLELVAWGAGPWGGSGHFRNRRLRGILDRHVHCGEQRLGRHFDGRSAGRRSEPTRVFLLNIYAW